MADRIVQLQNKAGDNIYPISRGIAENSVDTAALKDSSVTSSKLDSTLYSRLVKKYAYSIPADKTTFTLTITPNGSGYERGVLLISYVANGAQQWGCFIVTYNVSPTAFSTPTITTIAGGSGITTSNVTNGVKFTPSNTGAVPYGSITIDYLTGDESIFGIATA